MSDWIVELKLNTDYYTNEPFIGCTLYHRDLVDERSAEGGVGTCVNPTQADVIDAVNRTIAKADEPTTVDAVEFRFVVS